MTNSLRTRCAVFAATVAFAPLAAQTQNPPASHAAEPPAQAPATEMGTTPAPVDACLLFSGPSDIAGSWGRVRFGATPLRPIATCEDPGFMPVYSIAQPDGSCLVFGSVFHRDPDLASGKLTDSAADMARTRSTWDIVRATTRDGVRFENIEKVFTSEPGCWTNHCAITYNPEARQFLLLRLLTDTNGFAYHAFLSADGRTWRHDPADGLFYDGDALSVFWSPVAHRYVVVSKSLQPVIKMVGDHGGRSFLLHNDQLRDRRVLVIRSSADGRHWEPSVSMDDIWDRQHKKRAVSAGFMIKPDADDPPDLEFYSGNGFWYRDRAFMMVLNYSPSPLIHGHGPQLDTEWWAGSDGLDWERPGRGINATGGEVTRITHNPMEIGDQLLFHYGTRVLGMPRDRITYVSARANARFSTRRFVMPQRALRLNAAIPSPDRAFATNQAYVMVAVHDDNGAVVPGFESTGCVLKGADGVDLPLTWNGHSTSELAGRWVTLHFALRSAAIYAVDTGPAR